MPADIINLRQARKARERAEHERQAAKNRARYGKSKAERKKDAGESAIAKRRHEGHRLPRADKPDPPPEA